MCIRDRANDARVATILWQNGSDWLVFSANLDSVAKSVTISGEAIAEQRLDLSPYEIQLVKVRYTRSMP